MTRRASRSLPGTSGAAVLLLVAWAAVASPPDPATASARVAWAPDASTPSARALPGPAPRPAAFPAAPAHVPDTTPAVLAGQVILGETGAPAAAARIELVGRGRTALTDSAGRFRLEGLVPGADSLRVSRLDGRVRTRAVRLRPGAVSRVEIVLEPRVIDVGGLEVTVEGRRRTKLERLAARIERGTGAYITRRELEALPGRLSRAFRGVLGARVAHVGRGEFRVLLRRGGVGRGHCPPELFVDGRRQQGLAVDAFDPDEVAAAEVYTAERLPGEFTTIRSMECGAVLIWTREFVR